MFWLALLGTVLLAASAASLTGFGFVLIAMPLMSLFLDVKVAIGLSVILSTVSSVAMGVEARDDIDWRRVVFMLWGMLPGLPLGLFALQMLAPAPLKAIAGALVIAAALLLWRSPVGRLRPERKPLMAAGLLSGVLQGSVGMAGPPVVLLLVGQGMGKKALRGTLFAYFTPTGLLAIAMYALSGILTVEVAPLVAAVLPALVAGLVLARWALPYVPRGIFRGLVLALILLAGLASLYAGVGELL